MPAEIVGISRRTLSCSRLHNVPSMAIRDPSPSSDGPSVKLTYFYFRPKVSDYKGNLVYLFFCGSRNILNQPLYNWFPTHID